VPPLVSREEHGNALGEEEGGEEVPDLSLAERLHGRIVGGALAPQFQEALSSVPSRLSSPLASLCFPS
jgi:hypothetical protein